MKRLYGIDLLKMLAMVMVVAFHIMGRGGVQEACAQNSHSLLYVVQSLFYAACACCVNCFVLATGFVMCRHTFKYSRIFKLWGEVVFYSLCMTAIAAVFFPELAIGWRDWLMAVMPITFERYWFVSRYVGLFFLIPFLNHLLTTLDRKAQDRLILTGFLLLSLAPSITGTDMFVSHFGYSVLWFVYLYLVAGYVSLNELWRGVTKTKALLLFATSVLGSFVFSFVFAQVDKRIGCFGGAWGAYSSPFILIEAVSLLIFFTHVNVSTVWLQRVIAYVGPSVFSVYVLHSNSVWRRMIGWNGKYAWLAEHGAIGVVGGVIGFACLIFICCVAIDIIRRQVVGFAREVIGK